MHHTCRFRDHQTARCGRILQDRSNNPIWQCFGPDRSPVAAVAAVASGLVVASGLAPRWAAKQPQNTAPGAAWHTAAFLLGLLRSPTRGKPARHNRPACHSRPACYNKPACHNKPACYNTPACHSYRVPPWQTGIRACPR